MATLQLSRELTDRYLRAHAAGTLRALVVPMEPRPKLVDYPVSGEWWEWDHPTCGKCVWKPDTVIASTFASIQPGDEVALYVYGRAGDQLYRDTGRSHELVGIAKSVRAVQAGDLPSEHWSAFGALDEVLPDDWLWLITLETDDGR